MGRTRRGSYGRGPRGRRGGVQVHVGVLRVIRPGNAVVETDEGSFPVAKGGIREAMSGDEVRVSLVRRGGQDKLAVVQGVIQRASVDFLGVYHVLDPLGVVVPLDERVKRDFFVLPEDKSPQMLGVRDGDVVLARIVEYPQRHSAGVVTLDRRVGGKDKIDVNIESVLASWGLAGGFSPAALAEAGRIRVDVDAALTAGSSRKDLRDRCCLTIDPADARDFDDAVFARVTPGGYELEVHIADVSHYLPWDSSLDLEARARGCSAYLVDRVVPMLPDQLCNDACSLRPGEDRLAMSVLARLDRRGRVRSCSVVRSAIRSRARLSYDEVEALIQGERPAGELGVAEGSSDEIADAIRSLDALASLRRTLRAQRGSIDFETKEARVRLDERGRPTGVEIRERTRATSLVEEAMLVANECVARLLAEEDVPCAYRVHESPSPDGLRKTLPLLRELELVGGPEAEELALGDPKATQALLARARGTRNEALVSSLLLRAQKRAVYLPQNQGHYALGAKAYCHFTSPIRRYPDVLVHRALKARLDGKLDGREQRAIRRQLPQLCRSCSERERAAEGAARASQRVKMAELYLGRVGERFSGVVVGCERYGLFVMLDESCAEGLLPTRAIDDGWMSFDEERQCLTGESGRVWQLGQRVVVVVTGANPPQGQIDLGLPKPGPVT